MSYKKHQDMMNLFTKIYGVGPKGAEKIIKSGITTLEQLHAKQDDFLNDKQKIGLKYYNDLNERIPRGEIDLYNQKFSDIFNRAASETGQSGALFEIVGSYRRESKDSGDIDVIITNPNEDKSVFTRFIQLLTEENIILHKLTDGDKQIKILVIAQLPGKPARRVDFMYSPYKEYPFAVLYFTGSKELNTAMRQLALDKGYTMNEHRIEELSSKKEVTNIKTEKDIFKFLGLKYIEPKNRIDKDSLIKTKKIKLKVTGDVFITEFEKSGNVFLHTQTKEKISDFIKKANLHYHTKAKPLISDDKYDIIKEYLEMKYPDAEVLQDVGAPVEEYEKNKVTLPYNMPSMDKIKPTTNALSNWLAKYKEPEMYVCSVKLDGVSGLYDGENNKLYTRGNGSVGQDVSYLISHLQLPETSSVLRGEFIISKENFKYFTDKANARNTVAGIINSKKVNPNEIKYVDFVVYEVIEPKMKPSDQFEHLTQINPKFVCQHTVIINLSNDVLSDLLKQWRNHSEYDMDGLVVYHDKMYKRTDGNPKNAFAFKMLLTEQSAEAKVVNVEWNASKDGYLKPRVEIEPIDLNGVRITYATGFNGSFIEKNKINIGSVIEITRSGDVIPYINNVIKPSAVGKMPDIDYVWNDTHVDIMLKSKDDDENVIEKNIMQFFSDVDGLGPGNMKKIIKAGNNTVPKILAMSKEDYLKVSGFKEKLATKIHKNIQNKVSELSLPELMSSSNVFGRGFGDKKIVLVLNKYPDILLSKESEEEKISKLSDIKGLAKKTSELFVTNIPKFIDFMKDAKLEYKLSSYNPVKSIKTDHILSEKEIVFTGIRDKKLEQEITNHGALIGSKIKKDTFVLVTNDMESTTTKMKEAKDNNIKIQTLDEFVKEYL